MIINSNFTNFEIGEHKLIKLENVLQYKYPLCEPMLDVKFSEEETIGEKKIYFVFDCAGEDALAHWIYETFIFYPMFFKLLEVYPNMKILTSNKKNMF